MKMTQFIIKAGRIARVGTMILQAISLVANITDGVIQQQQDRSNRQTGGDQNDPTEGE
jgi:hypothetical protein